MADRLDDLTRLALLEAWSEKCAWCGRPLYFNEMEVEHLIPKSLIATDIANLLEGHGLPNTFELETLENLVPSCGRCNRDKGAKPPPEAPFVTNLLRAAGKRAPDIRATASKGRSKRALTRALTVVRESAAGGDAEALDALRRAADEATVQFREATGRTIHRLSAALNLLADSGSPLRASDSHFFYPAAAHETDSPAPPVTPGAVMSIAEISPASTSRVDVVPRDQGATDLYGPEFTLSAAEGEVGERAAAKLSQALREGRRVEIDDGIDLTFARLPPALSELVGHRLSGGKLIIEPQSAPARPRARPWKAEIIAATTTGKATVTTTMRQDEDVPQGWGDAFTGTYAGLKITLLTRRHGSGGEVTFNFRYSRDASPVRLQLAALRFLETLARGGELRIVSLRGRGRRPSFTTTAPANPLSTDQRQLLRFMELVRAIETWTGVEFQLPDEISGDDVQLIARLGAIIEAGGRKVQWSDANFTVNDAGLDKLREGAAVRIDHRVTGAVLGRVVDVGTVVRVLPAYRVASVTPTPSEPGFFDVRLEPPSSGASDIFERLVPPKPASRRPPPPPRKKRKPRGR